MAAIAPNPYQDNQALTRLTRQAATAGMPRDQLEGFLRAGYVPFPQWLAFHAAARAADRIDGPDELGLGGKRGPGKSHAVFAQAALDDCQRRPGLKVLYLRKVMQSSVEGFEDLVERVLAHTPHTYREGRVDFANGSRILIGGYYAERDIDKYLGIQYDMVIIEEATQLSETKIERIYGSIRTARQDWRPRKYLTTNPAGIGVTWYKRRFITPWREGKEKWTRYFHGDQDNPVLDAGYKRYLDGLTGPLRKAWKEGDWDAFEGMALPDWNADIHVCDPFEIPNHWTRWRAVDDGFINPWCCGFFAREPGTGRIILYRELYETLLSSDEQAQRIRDNSMPGEVFAATYADPAMFARVKKDKAGRIYSAADDYTKAGVPLTPADNARVNGKRKLHNALGMLPDGRPGLVVFRNCENVRRTFPELPSDPNNPEDVDTKSEDHAYDMLRYGLTSEQADTQPKDQDESQINPWLQIRRRR